MGCLTWIFWVVGVVLLLVSVIRWFEQTAEAVDEGAWNKLALLTVMPLAVWLFPSKVSAGRGFPVPKHEPVRGFGKLPKGGLKDPEISEASSVATPSSPPASNDQPPPGTPQEFLGIPEIPLAKRAKAQAIDQDKVEKLKQKMRDQGMLPPES